MERIGTCATHLEEFNDPSEFEESREVTLGHVTLHFLSLLDGHFLEGRWVGGKAVFLLEVVDVGEAQVLDEGKVYHQKRHDDNQSRVLVVRKLKATLQDGHRRVTVL